MHIMPVSQKAKSKNMYSYLFLKIYLFIRERGQMYKWGEGLREWEYLKQTPC